MGSLWPFPAFSIVGVKETAWIAIFNYPSLHNEAVVAWEVKFCECRKSPNNVAFDEAVKLSRVSQALSVWPFSMLLYWKVWTHPLSLCSFPVHSLPVAQWQLRTKKTLLSCSLCTFSILSFFLFFLILFFFFSQTGIGQSTISLFLQLAGTQWILTGLVGVLPSLGLFSFPFFFCNGERM